jgi:hypothetical protein
MSDQTCGCCEGLEPVTPRPIFNRPGLTTLGRRVGEYADFYETLLSRISTQWVDVETDQTGPHGEMLLNRLYPLRDLRTRSSEDMTIALLDAWAITADVLAFYSERIANEGYLNTSTELLSLIELARLVGYRRRPGVSASVYLAFTADNADVNASGLILPAGARVQSAPDPGQSPQTFETDAPLLTRPEWNLLKPRQVRPTHLPLSQAKQAGLLYFKGASINLTANTVLLLVYGFGKGEQVLRLAAKATPDFEKDWTLVELFGGKLKPEQVPSPVELNQMVAGLEKRPSIPPASPARLALSATAAFSPASAATDGLLARFHPQAAKLLPAARANAVVTEQSKLRQILAMRVKAGVYANTAQKQAEVDDGQFTGNFIEWSMEDDTLGADGTNPQKLLDSGFLKKIDLDAVYDSIQPGSWVAIIRPSAQKSELREVITLVDAVQTVSRTSYLFPGKVTRLILRTEWLDEDEVVTTTGGEIGELILTPFSLAFIRSTTVYAAPEPLALADAPVENPVCAAEIELDQLVDGLEPGRWLIISGERADSAGVDGLPVEGIPATELVMLSATRQDILYLFNDRPISISQLAAAAGKDLSPEQLENILKEVLANPLPGDKTHTFVTLSAPLAYCYKRDTIKIYANVAHATHGETQTGALGSGDGSKTFQTFDLKGTPPPLTYTAAVATSGVESSLKVYVNDVRWREAENSLDLGPASHGFLTFTDDKEKTSVKFGDGINGARLPSAGASGQENVQSVYRRGIGKPGNVREGQIKRIIANADGMGAVINPQPSSGGADPDGPDSTRRRTPLAVSALDRLVAVEDYADFARLFAGIDKASAARLPTRHGHLVHITIAGVDDIPIDETSDLYRSLLESLKQFGDPYLPVQLERRDLTLLVISAKVKIDPDTLWEKVEAAVRAALLDAFGFPRRELGQDAYASEAIAVMQAVPGVVYVDLDLFAGVPENTPPNVLINIGKSLLAQGVRERIPAGLDRIDPQTRKPAPSGLAILSPDVPSTVLLSQIAGDS